MAQSCPMRYLLPHHLGALGFCIVASNGGTGLSGHTHSLTHICEQANLIKKLCKDIKHALEPCCLNGHKKAIIVIKVICQPLNVSLKSL